MHCILASLIVLVGMSFSQTGYTDKSSAALNGQVRVLPVGKTPESDTVFLTTSLPKTRDMITDNPVWVQFRIDGYALGTDSSQFDRSEEIAVSDMGQTVHVIVDNDPYFPINEPAINPFNEEGYYHFTNYKFELPKSLTPGCHVMRMFPARSYGESLKGSNTFSTVVFYLGDTGNAHIENELNRPYLTYNEPSNNLYLTQDLPVLLDFLVANCELTTDGYKIRLSIDGKYIRNLTTWQPYYIYGLKKGTHTLRLELLDASDKKVEGKFNDVQRAFTVH